jgi:UDP-N-acetylglucosamine 2-epimerase (non-hydrolysing)
MKVLSVVGARPQFVKLAPVAEELARTSHEHVIVHTGQHYDPAMSDVFFHGLQIPAPDVHLGVGSSSHGVQTGAILGAMDAVVTEHKPDWVLVYGDTNSTLAGALAAVKLHVPVAHLEAGLRSFNRLMPEEHNRVLTDHAADLLLAPTEVAMGHLAREGLAARSRLVGDVMTDVCFRVRDAVAGREPPLPPGLDVASGYLVATLHRAENTDDPQRLGALVAALQGLPVPVVLLAHPRLVARAASGGVALSGGAVHQVAPAAYDVLVDLVLHSRGVVTDSGGLQKEAFLLGRTCTTLRTETEWVETLDGGWNVVDPDLDRLGEIVTREIPATPRAAPYGEGHAAVEVVRHLSAAGPADHPIG